jgi:hypothetical protein
MDNMRMDTEPTVPASRFKAQCLAILDRMARARGDVRVIW